ncbi:MAG: hypothetical protein IH600_03990 [Bacteroidetes bacterium]|nr:hypothetical protein [Bacteroidota bacterium]
MKKSRIIIITVLSVIVIAVTIGLMMYFKPHKDFADATPDYELTVAELIGAFASDEAAATATYVVDDKTVLVSGIVRETDTDSNGCAVIVLGQNGTEGSVCCTLTPDESTASITIRPGDPIRIQGQCTGMQELIEPQVIMIRCALPRK